MVTCSQDVSSCLDPFFVAHGDALKQRSCLLRPATSFIDWVPDEEDVDDVESVDSARQNQR